MHIGHREFINGQTRAVHIDDDGNQYGYAGKPVFGVRIAPDATDAIPRIFLPGLDDSQDFPA